MNIDSGPIVDQILNWKGQANAGLVPLDIDLGSEIPAKRLVIIRDLKTSDGSKDTGKDDKHRQLIFAEMQLALYARAWELLHPGDRVIGVGTSVIGNNFDLITANHVVEHVDDPIDFLKLSQMEQLLVLLV